MTRVTAACPSQFGTDPGLLPGPQGGVVTLRRVIVIHFGHGWVPSSSPAWLGSSPGVLTDAADPGISLLLWLTVGLGAGVGGLGIGRGVVVVRCPACPAE